MPSPAEKRPTSSGLVDSANTIIKAGDRILVTGASGFIGVRVIASLLSHGFCNLRCLVRPSANTKRLKAVIEDFGETARVEIIGGNLLSREDCLAVTEDSAVIYHLAAGTGASSFPDAFMNSVVTTRNLLDATLRHECLKRLVNVGSFAVYSNRNKPDGKVLDESCPVEEHAEHCGEPYCYAKLRQDEIVRMYGKEHRIPYVIIRPGVVYGPGKKGLIGRIGIGTFGIFLHLGGSNTIPLTYVDNCAEAIVLAGLRKGVEAETFNIVDDDLPTSRQILRLYKKHVKSFKSIYVPSLLSYLLFYAWEKYSGWSQGQLPPVYNRRAWHAYWKASKYSNAKVKRLLGWTPRVPTAEGLNRYLRSCQAEAQHG